MPEIEKQTKIRRRLTSIVILAALEEAEDKNKNA